MSDECRNCGEPYEPQGWLPPAVPGGIPSAPSLFCTERCRDAFKDKQDRARRGFDQQPARLFLDPHRPTAPPILLDFDGADEGYKDAHLAASVARDVLYGSYTWTPDAGWQRTSGDECTPISEEAVRERVRRWLLVKWREAKKAFDANKNDEMALNAFEGWDQTLALSRAGAILQYAKGIMLDAAPPAGGRVDLAAHLDGAAATPQPAVGALRDDGRYSLYPGRWHTLTGPTETGKSWVAVAHARDELLAWHTVVYVHFEEDHYAGTVARLQAMDVPMGIIRERFVWLSRPMWRDGDMAADLAALDEKPSLVVLDGINAACSRHGQDVEKNPAVGWYRNTFVTPATKVGAAVLSLGHPVKDRTRQDERHGYGASAWLDEVDGVAFRTVAGREPIRRGAAGAVGLHVVKDRSGHVREHGTPGKADGWTYVGSLVVDDSTAGLIGTGQASTKVRIAAPAPEQVGRDAIDGLADQVKVALSGQPGQRYTSQNKLGDLLRAAGYKFDRTDLGAALQRMQDRGELARDPEKPNRPRAGWLTGGLGQDHKDEV